MSRAVEKTLVLSFSGGVTSNAAGTVRAAWDDALNRGSDGQVKSQFVPGDAAWLIVQADPSVRITRVLATAGAIVALGEVSRRQTDSLLFAAADSEQSLSWRPSGGVSSAWYGNQGSSLRVNGQTVTVGAGHPCRALFSYTARCMSYRLQTPAVKLATGQEYPIDVVVYYTEVS